MRQMAPRTPQKITPSPVLIMMKAIAFLFLCVSAASGAESRTNPQETVNVHLKLLAQGAVSGAVIDHSEVGLVVAVGNKPMVFAWEEVEAGSAYRAKRDLLALERGQLENLTAEDHFQLGLFALQRNRPVVARNEFRQAEDLDHSYRQRVDSAFAAHRARRLEVESRRGSWEIPENNEPFPDESLPGLEDLVGTELPATERFATTGPADPQLRARVREVYDRFGETVRRQMGANVVLVETDHFLVWTDWDPRSRKHLGEWCELMYRALCRQFGFDPQDDIFLAKCPLFCWRTKGRFMKFARLFDGYEGKDAVGYTRSIEANGHVHIVLFLSGRDDMAYDRFAATLVHEGTHAFVHRTYSTRLIPHWVNEGLAELISERVLGDRCFASEKADLLARQYVRHDWPITRFLQYAGPIEVHDYPLAASVVAYLERKSPGSFARFIRGLKEGRCLNEALTLNYDGMDVIRLEAAWREAVRREDPHPVP
jgi:hypothetical protein